MTVLEQQGSLQCGCWRGREKSNQEQNKAKQDRGFFLKKKNTQQLSIGP